MSGSDDVETTKKGYAAFAAADLEAAMASFDDDVEWVQPGRSAVSGTYHGKSEVAGLLAQFAGKAFSSKPIRFVADVTIEGESAKGADVFTFRDGKITKAESFGDTAAMERVFAAR
jgi:ketosteroid isomerase-like protein